MSESPYSLAFILKDFKYRSVNRVALTKVRTSELSFSSKSIKFFKVSSRIYSNFCRPSLLNDKLISKATIYSRLNADIVSFSVFMVLTVHLTRPLLIMHNSAVRLSDIFCNVVSSSFRTSVSLFYLSITSMVGTSLIIAC
jgi:hypothetical protein